MSVPQKHFNMFITGHATSLVFLNTNLVLIFQLNLQRYERVYLGFLVVRALKRAPNTLKLYYFHELNFAMRSIMPSYENSLTIFLSDSNFYSS